MRLPHKKREENKMRKRNLCFVGLLLVFGLGAMASSLFAVTGIVFGGSNITVYYSRFESDAEGVGTISLSTTSTGTIKAGSAWYITYNAPIASTGARPQGTQSVLRARGTTAPRCAPL
jgi:hypothetical protein